MTRNKKKAIRMVSMFMLVAIIFSVMVIPIGEVGGLAITADAAETTAFDILTTSSYAKTYALSTSGKTIPYTSKYLTVRGTTSYGASNSSYIANSSDEIYILDVGCTNGKYWAYVSYPTSSRRVYAYIDLTTITKNNGNHKKTISTGRFYCSLRENSSVSTSYYVDKGDTVFLVATSGNKYQILYNISGGKYRLAWCNKADYQRYCDTQSTSGLIDVTAYFAGQIVTIKSLQNGKYLCADSSLRATPIMCNKKAANNAQTTFNVTQMTSDGWIGFKSAFNNKYVGATNTSRSATVAANASNLCGWECFRIYYKGGYFYIKSQATNKWLTTRVDLVGTPLYATGEATNAWERFSIEFKSSSYISAKEMVTTAVSKDISAKSNAYKALLSINEKYAPKLNASVKNGAVVYMFEGVGNNSSANKRMNAMCVVVKKGDIVYLNRNSSTIPDCPFSPWLNDGKAMPTLKSGIYNFSTVNHKNQYAAINVNADKVVRFNSKTSFYLSTSGGINVHRRSSYDLRKNSTGCLLVGNTGVEKNSEYANFIKSLGIVGSNAYGNSKCTNRINGKIVVDRTFAKSYLASVGYSQSAIALIG